MNLLVSLRSEMLKTRRTASFYFTLVGAAVVPAIFLLNVSTDGIRDTRKDPLNAFFKLDAEVNGLVIFPMFVILACTLLSQVEYRNNTWKQVFASPQKKATLYAAKFLNVHFLLLLFLTANILFMFLMILAANFIDPSLNLLKHSLNGWTVLLNTANTYVTILAVCAPQFWFGLRFRNFIVPVAAGLALWLAGTLLVFEFHSSISNYFPYCFHIFPVNPKTKAQLGQVAWTSVGYAALFLFAGFWDFRRRSFHN